MTTGQILNGVFRTTYLGVAVRFFAAWRMLYRGARGIVLAIRRLVIAARSRTASGIRAIGQSIRRTIHGIGATITSVSRSVNNRITNVQRGIGAAFAFVFRYLINLMTNVRRCIAVGILSAGRANSRFMLWTRHTIATGAGNAAGLAAMLYIGVHHATVRLAGRVGSFIRAKYRSFVTNLASTTLTLSIEDGHARLLVIKGDRVIAWRSGQIARPPEEPSPDPDEDPANAAESKEKAGAPVFNPLGSLLKGLPVRGNRVVTDLPLHVPLLRHVPIPNVKGRYLREIVTAEVLDSVPFADDEVDIHWRITEGESTREASVIAVPRDHMDGQVGIIRDSQLAPSAVYPKAAALAAAVGRPDVLILHLTKAQAAVVLVRGGVPRIVHRLELPPDTTEQAENIAMGVGQVAGYHRSQRPEDDVSGLPVVVTGEVDQMHVLLGPLASALDRPVQIFHSDLEGPDGFDSPEYASNIGLFLTSRSKKSAKLIAAQNVLPERHRPQPLPVAPAAVFTVLLGLGILAINLTGWVSGVAGEVGPLNAKLDIREDQVREYRLTMARQGVIDQQISDADLEALELEANLLSLKQEMGILLSRINDITSIADSSNVALSRLVPMPEGFSVSGSAESYSDVLGYAASIRSSPNFEDATVLQVADSAESRLGFTVVATVPTPGPADDGEADAHAQIP